MNERIQELALYAWRLTADETAYLNRIHNRTIEQDEITNIFEVKFAQLIVKECMDICKQHPSRIVSNNWNAGAVAPHLVKEFKEHFGVEE